MKKLVATTLAIAMGLGAAFAQEAGHIASLESAAGKISFGAWGRSTFNIGNEYTKTDVEGSNIKLQTVNDRAYANAEANGFNYDGMTIPGGKTGTIPGMGGMTFEQAYQTYADTAESMAAAGVAEVVKGASDSENKWIAEVAPDWSYGCRVGFWIIGRTNDEKWGFDFNLDSDGRALLVDAQGKSTDKYGKFESGKAAVSIGDQAKMWAIFDEVPMVDLKVAFGKMRENELVGSVGDFGQRESSDAKTDDDLFTRFNPFMGLFVSATGKKGTALEGLYVAADVDACDLISDNSDYKANLSDVVRKGQAGIGYTIPGLLQVKAQMWGDSIEEKNSRYASSKYAAARAAGFGSNDYFGRAEFGVKWLGFTGGATGLGDVDLSKTPNANVTELGVKVPVVTDNKLRKYDPEMFYDYYAVLGTMGVIQQGFILYKAHAFLGQGESDLANYSMDYVKMAEDKPADILMTGFDALAEVCLNPFGKQDNFLGLSFNYNLTSAKGSDSVQDVTLAQHNFGAEVYFKKTFASNNYFFIGFADRLSISKLDGTISYSGLIGNALDSNFGPGANAGAVGDVKLTLTSNKVYMPIGVEMFF